MCDGIYLLLEIHTGCIELQPRQPFHSKTSQLHKPPGQEGLQSNLTTSVSPGAGATSTADCLAYTTRRASDIGEWISGKNLASLASRPGKCYRFDCTAIEAHGPRGKHSSILRTTKTNCPNHTSYEQLQNMSSILRKRRPTASGTEIGPSSCTNRGYYRSSSLTTFPSEKTAIHRCGKDVTRHRKGVCRCSPAPQIVFGRDLRTHQTLRSAFLSNRAAISLTYPSQQSKDIEDKLGDLAPWLVKLKDSVATAGVDGNHEEAERRERLTRFVSCLYVLETRANRP